MMLITVMVPAQVRVMTALRHPNVVLFMAASTKAPKMCIVMEFMSLGSLYEVRHHHYDHRPNHQADSFFVR